MSTAVIITGQMRTFAEVWTNQFWMVYRKLRDPYFFISIADDQDAKSADLILQRFPKEKVFVEYVKQPTLEEPKEPLNHGAFPRSAPVQGVLRQLWALNQGWSFYEKTTAKADGVRFSEFIRIRPDLHFHGFRLPWLAGPRDCFTPWWSRWGGSNDRFAYMGAEAASAYFTTFQRMDEMLKAGAPLHPESLIEESLLGSGCVNQQLLRAVFTTLRKDGTKIAPDPNILDLADIHL